MTFFLVDKREVPAGAPLRDVRQTAEECNEVAEDFMWVEVPDAGVAPDTHFWDGEKVVEIPPPPPPPPPVVDHTPGSLDVIQLLLDKQLLAPADLRQEWRDILGV